MEKRFEVAKKITFVSIVGNIFLSVLKIFIGLIGRSSAMVADGFHSVSDVVTSIVALFAVKFSSQDDDENHQYGHEKIELVISKILAIILMLTGVAIAYKAFFVIKDELYEIPSSITIIAAVISIISKEAMYRYTIKGAIKIDSKALEADAWHHRSDALSSVGALVGIVGAINGIAILDPIASIVIAVLVIKVAVDIYIDSVKGLIDRAAPEEVIEEIKTIVNSINGVLGIDDLKTRMHSNKLYVDVEISANGHLTLFESHAIAENVHDSVEEKVKNVKHCMVHVNPKEI